MKEATGELSTTVITVVAIAAVMAIFTAFIYPALKAAIRARTYCQSSVQCTACEGGKQECHYYNDDMTVSEQTIVCDCGDAEKSGN